MLDELELAELDRGNWDAINTILAAEGAAIFEGLVERYPDRSSDHLKSLVRTGKLTQPPTISPPRTCRRNGATVLRQTSPAMMRC